MHKFPGFLRKAISTVTLLLLAGFVSAASRPFDSESAPAGGVWLVRIVDGYDPVEIARNAGAEYIGPLQWVNG